MALQQADERYQQSTLEAARRRSRLIASVWKMRLRVLIKLGTEAVKCDLTKGLDPALQAGISQARAELHEIEQALSAVEPKSDRHAWRDPSPGSVHEDKNTNGELDEIGGKKNITVGFARMPPEELRAELGRLTFKYTGHDRLWRGVADPEVLEDVIAANIGNVTVCK